MGANIEVVFTAAGRHRPQQLFTVQRSTTMAIRPAVRKDLSIHSLSNGGVLTTASDAAR